MTAQLLVVDAVSTNRIMLKVKLEALRYRLLTANSVEEALDRLATTPVALVVLSVPTLEACGLARLEDLRRASDRAPLLALGPFGSPDSRMAWLAAGVDEILPVPVHDVVLFARVRALLRLRATEGEARVQAEIERSLGLAEEEEPFRPPARVTLVSNRARHPALSKALPGQVQRCDFCEAPAARSPGDETDLYVLDAAALGEAEIARHVFKLLADLRGRDGPHRAAQLLILPRGAEELAAMALDLGVDDIVEDGTNAEELRLRAQRLVARKHRRDSLRDTLETGLRAAVTDPLTGLYNRRYALPHLRRTAERHRTAARPFAVLLIDIDHFKHVNDYLGHGCGDRVLTELADRLRGALRPGDLAARIGGEEFLVVLPDTDRAAAAEAAARLCRLMEETPFDGPREVALTVSIGGTLDPAGAALSPEALIDAADGALYEAKRGGRNRVTFAA